jgi:hypothetical protein
MSYYKDIYNDFPLRCGKLWLELREQAKEKRLDVTFMLMTASAGLVAPWEHLKQNALGSDEEDRHPAFTPGNDKHYKAVLKTFQNAINPNLFDSQLFRDIDIKKWKLRTLKNRNQIIGYLEGDATIGQPFVVRSSRDMINVFRNALAHNNFHAYNRTGASEIDEVAFFSEARGAYNKETKQKDLIGYNVVSLPHGDLASFLDKWFDLLRSIQKNKEHLRKVLKFVFPEQNQSDAA